MISVHDDGVTRGEQRALGAKLGLCQRQLRFETSASWCCCLSALCAADGRCPCDKACAASGYCDLNNNGINSTPAEAALRNERDGTGGVAGLSVLSAVDRRRDESIQESM